MLYLRNCRSYHQDFDHDIYSYFSLYFFKKYNIVNIKTILLLLAHFKSLFFLIRICFLSSSMNAKKKFWSVPHLLHMCVIFFFFFGVAWMESWSKAFGITYLWLGSLGKFFWALLRLLEKDGKYILTIAGPVGILSDEVPWSFFFLFLKLLWFLACCFK